MVLPPFYKKKYYKLASRKIFQATKIESTNQHFLMKLLSKTIGILIIIMYSATANAQEALNVQNIDTKTYNYFLKAQWDSLIFTGKNALDDGIDFYYLQLRIGIAYFNKKNYRKAIPYFEKSLEMALNKSLAIEYLYYSYLYGGATAAAGMLEEEFSDKILELKKIEKNKLFESIFVEGGYTETVDFEQEISFDYNGEQNIYGEFSLNKKLYYYSAGLTRRFSPRSYLSISFGQIKAANHQRISGYQIDDKPFDNTATQNQYYAAFAQILGKRMILDAAVNYLTIDNNFHYVFYDEFWNPTIKLGTKSLKNYVMLLGLQYKLRLFDLSFQYTLSNLNSEMQTQARLSAFYYPFGNLNLYIFSSVVSHKQTESVSYGKVEEKINSDVFFQTKIGGKLFSDCWIEAGGLFRNVENYNESNAFLIYNDATTIKKRYDLNLIFPFKKIEFSIRSKYYLRQTSYLSYFDVGEDDYKYKNYQYNNYSIIGGLIWRF